MENRGNIKRLPIITLVIVAGAFLAVTALFYHNTLIEKQLEEMDSDVSRLNDTVNKLTRSLEISRENMQEKDETIKNLQQAVTAEKQIKNEKNAAEQIWIATLISKLQPKIDPVVADVIAGSVYKHSRKYGIPPELIVNVAMRESSFRLILESNKKAKGLMQVMTSAHPEKIQDLGINNENIFHIDNNIHLGTMILAEYYESKKSIYAALESYVGAELKNYIADILVGFADTKIEQFRAMPPDKGDKEKESEPDSKEETKATETEKGDTKTEKKTTPDEQNQSEEKAEEPSQNSNQESQTGLLYTN